MDSITWLNLGLAVVNFAVAIFQGWKEWHSHRGAHPLQPVTRRYRPRHPRNAIVCRCAGKVMTPADRLARVHRDRIAAGVCRHCGGPVPCASAFGDIRVGVRRGQRRATSRYKKLPKKVAQDP